MTGSYDLSRISLNRDEDELKVVQAFIMTMPGIQLIYYGDEIGMRYIPDMRSVEGAYKRTGSRTPTQWNDEKNYGFSVSEHPYVSPDKDKNAPTVQKQEHDSNSLLNHMKKMIQIRKKYPALQENGEFKAIETGYPAIYERSIGDERIRIIINPSDRKYTVENAQIKEIIAQMNAEMSEDLIYICGCGYFIYK